MYDDNQTVVTRAPVQERLPSAIKLSSDNQRLIINVDTLNEPVVEPKLEPEVNLVTIAQ